MSLQERTLESVHETSSYFTLFHILYFSVETQFFGTAQDTVPFATMYEKVSHSVTWTLRAAAGAATSSPLDEGLGIRSFRGANNDFAAYISENNKT